MTNNPQAENATSIEDAPLQHGTMKKLKDAIRVCLLKPRKSLNGDNLTAKKGEHLPHAGR